MAPTDTRSIDIVSSLTGEEAKDLARDLLEDLTRLTAAIRAKHPLLMGKGDGTIDAAIRLITECTCR